MRAGNNKVYRLNTFHHELSSVFSELALSASLSDSVAISDSELCSDLELEQAPFAQQPVYLGDVGFDDLATGDVLKDNVGVGEVVLAIGDYGQIAAVVLIQVDVGAVGQSLLCAGDHFPAHVNGVNFPEYLGKSASNSTCSAADFQDLHLAGLASLANVFHVGQDVFLDGLFARGKEGLVGPLFAACRDIVAGVSRARSSQSWRIFSNCSAWVIL